MQVTLPPQIFILKWLWRYLGCELRILTSIPASTFCTGLKWCSAVQRFLSLPLLSKALPCSHYPLRWTVGTQGHCSLTASPSPPPEMDVTSAVLALLFNKN